MKSVGEETATKPRTLLSLKVLTLFFVIVALGLTALYAGMSVFPRSDKNASIDSVKRKPRATEYVQGRLIITLRDTISVVARNNSAPAQGMIGAGPYAIKSPKIAEVARRYSIKGVHPILSPKAKKLEKIKDRIFTFDFDPKLNHREIFEELMRTDDIASVDYDTRVNTLLVPDDPFYGSENSWGQGYLDLWGLYKMELTPTTGETPPGSGDSGWDYERGNNTTVLAIPDTGVDYGHEDLASKIWVNEGETAGNGLDDDDNGYIDDWNGFDFVNGTYYEETGLWRNDADGPLDDHYHGTHVAGTAAAATNNGVGVAGVCWYCAIMPVKGLDQFGMGYVSRLMKTVEYAVENGAAVINMSWGGRGTVDALNALLAEAHDAGVTLVAAAGNSSADALSFHPANSPSVITVGSIAPDDTRSSFSNYGIKIDVTAPGGGHETNENNLWRNILSAKSAAAEANEFDVDERYRRLAGTSMAAPHITGLVGLLKSQRPTLGPETARAILRQTAYDANGNDHPGWDLQLGHGLANAPDALLLTDPLTSAIHSPDNFAPITPGEEITVSGSAGGTGFIRFSVEIAQIPENGIWTLLVEETEPVTDGALAVWTTPSDGFGQYFIKLTVYAESGQTLSDVKTVAIGLHAGWPKYYFMQSGPAIGDLDPSVPGDEMLYSDLTEDGFVFEAYHHDGTPVAQWQNVTPNATLTDKPVIADIDPERPGKEVVYITGLGTLDYRAQDGTLLGRDHLNSGSCTVSSSVHPLVADVTDDPGLEIIAGAGCAGSPSWMAVWNSAFQPIRQFITGEHLRSTPTAADIDGDSLQEILIGAMDKKIYAWNADGTIASGAWPSTTSWVFYAGITAANLDHQGNPEIIAANTDGDLYIKNSYGYNLSGWPKDIGGWYDGNDDVTVADIDFTYPGLEIIIGSFTNILHAYRLNGTEVPGFPIEVPSDGEYGFGGTPLIVQLDPSTPEPEIYVDAGHAMLAYTSRGVPLPQWTVQHPDHIVQPYLADIDADGQLELLIRSFNAVYLWDLPVEAQDMPWPQLHLNESNNASSTRCSENVQHNTCLPEPPAFCQGFGVETQSCGEPGQCGCPVPEAECQADGSCACPGGLQEGQCTGEAPYGCRQYRIESLCAGADNIAENADDCGCPASLYCDAGQLCRQDHASSGVYGTYFCGEQFEHAYASNVRERRINWPGTLSFHLEELGRYTDPACNEYSNNSMRWRGYLYTESGPVTFYLNGATAFYLDDMSSPKLDFDFPSQGSVTLTMTRGWHPIKVGLSTPMHNGITAQLGWVFGDGPAYNEQFPNGFIDVDHLVPPQNLRYEPPAGGKSLPIEQQNAGSD